MQSQQSILEVLEETPLQKFHWKTMFVAGMGFFTDAYDLFIIGVVTTLLGTQWNLTKAEIGLLNATSLIAAALGAIILGRLADRLGRKTLYGLEVTILTIGALLSATSQNFDQLLIWRFIIGLGIGGDYSTSATIMSEYANRKNRGRLVTTVFAMQGFGLMVGPIVASLLLWTGISHDVVWRIMLALGAIPSAAVIYLRRKIPETPRFLVEVKQDAQSAANVVSELMHQRLSEKNAPNRLPFLKQSAFWLRLLGTAGSWFFLDIAFYGNSVSSTLILHSLAPNASLIHATLLSATIFLVFALPGYWVSAFNVDRIGRKKIQFFGFLVMTISFACIGWIPNLTSYVMPFVIIYGISYFFTEFGPNTTTFVVPSEVFPTEIRGFANGISAGSGKIGAFIGALIVPILLARFSLSGTEGIMAIVSALGMLTTLLIPEFKERSLSDQSSDGESGQTPNENAHVIV